MEPLPHEEIQRSLGRIEGGVQGIKEELKQLNGRVLKQGEDIVTLQVQQVSLKTKIAILGASIAFSVSMLWDFIKSQFMGK